MLDEGTTFERAASQPKSLADTAISPGHVRFTQIVLQKSNVAGRRILANNPKREAVADSYNLNRVTEVACEFNVRR